MAKIYVKNVKFRIPGPTTRTTIGPRIMLGILEHIWNPFLDIDEDSADNAIQVEEGDYGISVYGNEKDCRRILQRQWMRKNADGSRRDVVAETYPGNVFHVAWAEMLRQDRLTLAEAARAKLVRDSFTNFEGPTADKEFDAIYAEMREQRDLVGSLEAAFGMVAKDEVPITENASTLDEDDADEIPDDEELTEKADKAFPKAKPAPVGDDFTKIRGIGPERRIDLNAAGYTTFEQLASADPQELDEAVDGIGIDLAVSICAQAQHFAQARMLGENGE